MQIVDLHSSPLIMFKILGTLEMVDHRQECLLGPSPKKSDSRKEADKSRASLARAKEDMEKLESKELSENLERMSLRALLELLDRQQQLSDKEEAKILVRHWDEEHQKMENSKGREMRALFETSLDKRKGPKWKESLLRQIRSAAELFAIRPHQHDELLSTSRRVVAAMQRLRLEAKSAAELKLQSHSLASTSMNADESVNRLIQTAPPQIARHVRKSRSWKGNSRKLPPLAQSTTRPEGHKKAQSRPQTTSMITKSQSAMQLRSPHRSLDPLVHAIPGRGELRKNRAHFAKLMQHYGDRKKRWSRILIQEMGRLHKRAQKQISSFQMQWVKIIALTNVSINLGAALTAERERIADENAKIQACIRLQSSFRGSFARGMYDKFVRVREMLLKRLWKIRLGLHAKFRARDAQLVRSFLKDFADVNPFKVTMQKFRYKIIWTQRTVRQFLACKRARLLALTKLWLRYEPKYANKRAKIYELQIKKAFSGNRENDRNFHTDQVGSNEGGKSPTRRRSSLASSSSSRRRSSSLSPEQRRASIAQVKQMQAMRDMLKKQADSGELTKAGGSGRVLERRASFSKTSLLAVMDFKQFHVDDEERRARIDDLIEALLDTRQTSKRLDYIRKMKKSSTKLPMSMIKRIAAQNSTAKRVRPSIRKKILLQVYRRERLKWASRSRMVVTNTAEMRASARLLLQSDFVPNQQQFAEVRMSLRPPEQWILYTRITKKAMIGLIKKGFDMQEDKDAEQAATFWESLS